MRHLKNLLILVFFLAAVISCNQNNNKETNTSKTDSSTNQKSKDSLNKSDSSTTNTGEDKAILDIRAEYDRVNAAKLSQKKYSFECDGQPNEGELVYYTENNKVVKVYVNWGLAGDFLRTSEYYYKDGKLFFIYETINGGAAAEAQRTDEERTYISNDKTIRYMENKKIVSCKTCEFNDKSLEYKLLKAYTQGNARKVICE